MESVVGEARLSSPRSVTVGADEVVVLDEPTAALQEHVAPKDTARTASPEIQEAEEGRRRSLAAGCGGR
jgi:hypothetical protein